MASAVNGVLLVCLCVGLVSFVDSECPRDTSNGVWVEYYNDGRCILKCYDGYQPSGCHVLRYSHSEGKWNHDVPTCQRRGDHFYSSRKDEVAAVQHTLWDALLKVARADLPLGPGFGAVGLAAWPIAVTLQFALSQTAGVIGIAATPKGAVGAQTGAITYATSSIFSKCEAE
eukprot:XP_011453749.1 PREDICTED: uncharacterized protein LOC105346735 [Crassostrea gigas]